MTTTLSGYFVGTASILLDNTIQRVSKTSTFLSPTILLCVHQYAKN